MMLMTANCAAVTFEWDPNTDNPIGYQIFFREKGGSEIWNTDAVLHPTVTLEVMDKYLRPGVVYEFWAIAYNEEQVSLPSEVLEYTRPAYVPKAPRFPPEKVYQVPVTPEGIIIQ
jgi:hypothetical protein